MPAEWQFLIALNERLRPLRDAVAIQKAAVTLLGQHLNASRVDYARIDGEEFVLVRSYANGARPFASSGPVAVYGQPVINACRRGETVVVDDVNIDSRFTEDERRGLLASETAAFAGAPLIKDDRWVAMLCIHSATPRAWTSDQVALLELTAERTWSAVERAHVEETLGRSEGRHAFLLRLNDALRPLTEPGAVQETAARLLAEHIGAPRVGYAEFDGRDYTIHRTHASDGPPLAGSLRGFLIGPELYDALLRGEVVVVNDVAADSRLTEEHRASMRARQIAAFAGVALSKDGQMVAVFGANYPVPHVWTVSEIELIRDVAVRTWDAVERTRAEAALSAQEQRLRLALDASAGGSWTWDAATNQVDWDERFRALYGFTPDEPATADAWPLRVHDHDRHIVFASLNEMLTTTKESWENTFRIVRPDATVTWIQSRGRAERDANGHLTKLTGLDLDFSHHHHAEAVLQARRDEEHDRVLSTLLQTARQGIVSMESQGTIVTANRAFEIMFGWAAGELVGQPIERLMAAFRDGLEQRPHLQLVGTRKDGSAFPIEVQLNHVPTPTGERVFAFVTDITERERAQSALQARTTELEFRTAQLRQMASELTLAEQHAREQIAKTLHDGLQQLLVIVAMNLERQQNRDSEVGTSPSEYLLEAKHHIDQAMAAARSLTVELFPPVLQRSGLPAALQWLAAWIQEKYKLEVRIDVDPRADSARKDIRTLLFESARELLFNAVKHAHVDRVTLELSLDSDDRLCITVSDQGIGFDPVLDGRPSAGHAGWGLVSIRERLILLGGGIDIESAPGRGTRVRLVAPRGAVEPLGVSSVETERIVFPSADSDGASPPAIRILIVDDHATVRHTLREMLSERPEFSVVGEASNGLEAIAHAHALRPHVILMDVVMPHMDGLEATARIAAEFPDIEIFGLSTHARGEIVQAIERAGATKFFVKGTDTQRLIDDLLALHATRRAGVRVRPM